MRIQFLFIALTLMVACNTKPSKTSNLEKVDTFICKTDTLYYPDTVYVGMADHLVDSLAADNKNLAQQLLNAKLKLKNIEYYVNLAAKNPSQQKFLVGWLKRPLEMK